MFSTASRWGSLLVVSVACAGEVATPPFGGPVAIGPNVGGSASDSGGQTAAGGLGSSPAAGGLLIGIGGASSAGAAGSSCAEQTIDAQVLPVYLAFAFDVSGSMGKGDQPWHDEKLKWDPVASATKLFFADPVSSGLWASLTFFPSDASSRCKESSYTLPDVPMTALPSPVFGVALDKVPTQAWRGGTPTLAVMRGVVAAVTLAMKTTPGRYVIVLVTDGYPEGCSDNAITSVAAVASSSAATMPTYVIGIANPPITGAPDTVSNLNQVAVAGGTQHAFLIDTGDPAKTTLAFQEAVSAIRAASISCEAPIPRAPAGQAFDKRRVSVSTSGSGSSTSLVYDTACAVPNAWHYDDAGAPQRVVLCPDACAQIQSDSSAVLRIEFACQDRIQVPL